MNNSLRSFLEMNLPVVSSKKKKEEEEEEGSVPPFSLGIIDPGLMHVCALSREIEICRYRYTG